MCYCILDDIVLKVRAFCLKNAVTIGTGYPARSYKKKYVINNWQCPEGAVKHWEQRQGESRDTRKQPWGHIPQGTKHVPKYSRFQRRP